MQTFNPITWEAEASLVCKNKKQKQSKKLSVSLSWGVQVPMCLLLGLEVSCYFTERTAPNLACIRIEIHTSVKSVKAAAEFGKYTV